jgi:peptidoglycan/xylan/chitin deacetylase (PgdA/CDA1 family)
VSPDWIMGTLKVAPRLLPTWMTRVGPVFVPVRQAAVRPAGGGLAAVGTARGWVSLVDDDGKSGHDLRRLERLLATEAPFPTGARRYPTFVAPAVRRKLARVDHELRRLVARAPWLAFSVGTDAVGGLAHYVEGTSPVDSWPDGRAAAFVVTHDVEESRERRALDLAKAEAEVGVRATYFLIPEQWRAGRLPDKLRALGHEIACHGIDHSGREAFAPVEALQDAARRLGLSRPFGYRSPRFACGPTHPDRIGGVFQYDSSRPDTRQLRRRAGWAGCGTVFPFLEGDGLIQLPVTLPTDLDLIDEGFDWPQVRVAWRAKWRWVREAKGLGVLCTHVPAPGGWAEVMPFLEEVAGDREVWTGGAGELAAFLAGRSHAGGALRPWRDQTERPRKRPPRKLLPMA